MRKHGWQLPYHPLQVVAVSVFLALGFAFYVFFAPFCGREAGSVCGHGALHSPVFNQKTLYDVYKKRTKNIVCDMEAYNKAKEADPEFYRDAASLQYGKVTKTPDENIDRMVKELEETKKKREAFSRRRKFHEEKDVDSINDRNEHFNKKIERAFGKYTPEIKNNLERGTALPD